MIQASSLSAYAEIEKRLPECSRPVYRVIFENPDICIGEIGRLLQMQNSTVSGRVNDLIENKLVFYVLDEAGNPAHKHSSVSGVMVQMLRANDVFSVDPDQIKQRKRIVRVIVTSDRFKVQGSLFPDTKQSN